MTCRELIEHLETILDGTASAAVTIEIEGHMRACQGCRRVTMACRETIAVYRRQTAPELPAAVHARVLERVSRRSRP